MTAEGAPIQTVAVIGAGHRGREFALRCARAGYRVVLEDVLSSRLRQARELLSHEGPAFALQVTLAGSVEDAVRSADIVVDFVPDELESKLEIFSMVDRMAPPRTVLCTPTQLSISDLASCTYRADRCTALLPFGEETDLVLVCADATSTATEQVTSGWLRSLGYNVQIRHESPTPVQPLSA
jgi:3-hydroxybutyryl-CoA dehydrogenase